MKIFYAIQATGNGHISRAMELLPHLREYGTVDIFLSGSNSNLNLEFPVKYRSKGVSLFYNCRGGLDYFKILCHIQLSELQQQIRDLPLEKYDLIINDFEYITAAACARKKIPSIHFGHQASFQSALTPRPHTRSITGEWLLSKYAKATNYIGLHFCKYDHFIFTPVIKEEILRAEPADKGYVTVYLPSYCEIQLETIFHKFNGIQFQIFSRQTKQPKRSCNICFLPVDKNLYNASLISCTGIITGGGFETPAEALYLGKNLMCIPINGHYEQQCNAAALKRIGVTCLKKIGQDFKIDFEKWMNQSLAIPVDYKNSIPQSLSYLYSIHKKMSEEIPSM
jgi:uncharacterized protein (TIGR00661 family)